MGRQEEIKKIAELVCSFTERPHNSSAVKLASFIVKNGIGSEDRFMIETNSNCSINNGLAEIECKPMIPYIKPIEYETEEKK